MPHTVIGVSETVMKQTWSTFQGFLPFAQPSPLTTM